MHAKTSQQLNNEAVAFSNEETSVFWDASSQSDRLFGQLKQLSRKWEQNIRRGARILRAHFKLHSPMFMRTYECPFIIQTFLGMSLERINWLEIAAQVLGIPVPEQQPLQSEEMEEHDPHVQLAILHIALELIQHDFGEYALESWCSGELQELCVDLAGKFGYVLQGIGKLKEQGRVFEE